MNLLFKINLERCRSLETSFEINDVKWHSSYFLNKFNNMPLFQINLLIVKYFSLPLCLINLKLKIIICAKFLLDTRIKKFGFSLSTILFLRRDISLAFTPDSKIFNIIYSRTSQTFYDFISDIFHKNLLLDSKSYQTI